jgi:hypothetical protein
MVTRVENLEKSEPWGYVSYTRVGDKSSITPPPPIVPDGATADLNYPGMITHPVEIGFSEDVKKIRWIWTEVNLVLYVTGWIKVLAWNE